MLDERGGIRCDLTVTRLADDRFLVITGGGSAMHDLAWMRRTLPTDGSVHVADVTSAAAASASGGRGRASVCKRGRDDDLSNAALPVLHGAPPDDRRRAGAGAARLLRRRARLGALRADRVRAARCGTRSGRPGSRSA